MSDVDGQAVRVFFVSDSTAITAETLGNALLANFPGIRFERHTCPFVDTTAKAQEILRRVEDTGGTPLIFMTVKNAEAAEVLLSGGYSVLDLLRGHLGELERLLGAQSVEHATHAHGVGDLDRYYARMRAVEFALEHDDAQNIRFLDQAELIVLGPSRCGKTPTSIYLALQHGLRVANYPLTEDDYPHTELPKAIAPYASRCFGLTSNPARLSQVRGERRPDSNYASLQQCHLELRLAESLYRAHRIPYLNSATKSVEEIAAVILHTMGLHKITTGIRE